MGNYSDKCSCICSKKEDLILTDSSLVSKSAVSRNSLKSPNLINEKDFMTVKNQNGMPTFGYNSQLNYTQVKLLRKLQGLMRGVQFRKKFPKLKIRLYDLTLKKIETFHNKFSTPTLTKAEKDMKKFNKEGWMKFYPTEWNQVFQGSKRISNSVIIDSDLCIYVGGININNQRCGYGELLEITGVKSQGTWHNNRLQGWGRVIDVEGTIWEGYYINGVLSGKGEKICLDGTHYIGEFSNNMKHGKGKEETPDCVYEGDFISDKKSGLGILKYKNINDSYEGEFKNDIITGKGFYRWANLDTFEGSFLEGKMHGRGIYRWPDGGQYEGDYVMNIKEGYGTFRWANGKIYKGPFVKGKPHGIGMMLVEKEGSTVKYQVEYKDGKVMKSERVSTKT